MDCPVCEKPMITVELHEVEIDYCGSCQGIWLDTGELEILLEDSRKAAGLVASFQPVVVSSQRPRPCPVCRKRMEIVDADGTGMLHLDRCRWHHGLWFDRGELEILLQRASLDTDGHVRTHLQELFIRNQGKESK